MAAEHPPVIATLQQPAGPISAIDRIEAIDLIRGFALFGILVVNMGLFGRPAFHFPMVAENTADAAVEWLVRIFAEGKFYVLFSFLFGLGMSLQMERLEGRSAPFMKLYCRRLLVLLGFGLAHALLLWEGDVLTWYALFGFLLLAFRNRTQVTLLVWALVCVLIPIVIFGAMWRFISVLSSFPEFSETVTDYYSESNRTLWTDGEESLRVYAEGTFGEIFVLRARTFVFHFVDGWTFIPQVIAMFLLGLYAGKRRIFQTIENHSGFFRRVVLIGLLVGLPASLVYAAVFKFGNYSEFSFTWVVWVAASAVGGPALGFAYAAGLTLVWRGERWRKVLRPIAAAGRMPLTNYLLQSLVCTTIFYSYGFGLYGSVGHARGFLIALIIFAAQVPLSIWWLKRFRSGPAEWVWRRLTYGTSGQQRGRQTKEKDHQMP